jgi:hypothetical protein
MHPFHAKTRPNASTLDNLPGMSALTRVRTAYPFHRLEAVATTRWACLLECGHTVELELAPGQRPRRIACDRCSAGSPENPDRDDFCIDFGEG